MAIYMASMKIGSRSAGRTATAAAAYRAAEKILDERTGLVFDYTKKSAVDSTVILAPENSPEWVYDRSKLWNKVEAAEKRKDAQVFRELVVAIPQELKPDEMKDLVTKYTQDQFVKKGMIADVAFHHLKSENPHAHIMLTMRPLNEQKEFGKKERSWNDKEQLLVWREMWSEYANKSLEKAGHHERIDHRTLEAQGIDRIAQVHLGAKIIKMEKRGIKTELGNRALEIAALNAEIIDLKLYREKYDRQAKEIAKNEISDRTVEASQKRGNLGGTDRTLGNGDGDVSRRTKDSDRIRAKVDKFNDELRRKEIGFIDRTNSVGRANNFERNREVISSGSEGKRSAQIIQFQSRDVGFLREHNLSSSYDAIIALSNAASKQSDKTADDRTKTGREAAQLGRKNKERIHKIFGDRRANELKPDKSYLAARRQLIAMGVNDFEIGIRDSKTGKMMNREWSLNETLKNIPWLKRENAKGADIYVRPAGEMNAGLILVDDLTRGKIQTMKNDGHNAAAIVETSPNNFQTWIKISPSKLEPEIATTIAKMMAKKYGADMNSADWKHYGRLAGFTNRKPEHLNEIGKSPFVLSHESTGKLAESSERVMAIVKNYLDEQKTRKEKLDRMIAIDTHRTPILATKNLDPTSYYLERQKSLKTQYAKDYDISRADFMISKELYRKKVTVEKITETLLQASPELAERKKGHIDDYLSRTVAKAILEEKDREREQQKTLQASKNQTVTKDRSGPTLG